MKLLVTSPGAVFREYWNLRNDSSFGPDPSVINVGMGSPSVDFQRVPPSFLAALMKHNGNQAVADYQPQCGEWPVRDAIAQSEAERIGGAAYSGENVLVTHGALAGMDLADRFTRDGRTAIAFSPEYFNITSNPQCMLLPRHGGRLTPVDVARLARRDFSALFMTNPNNPLGLYEEPQILDSLLDVCRQKKAYMVIDETCDCCATPARQPWPRYDSRLIRVNGISKRLNVAGCRFGWVLASAKAIGRIQDGIPRSYGNVSLPVSRAFQEFVTHMTPADRECLAMNTSRVIRSRELACDRLASVALCKLAARPEASYYLTLILNTHMTGDEVSRRLWTEHKLDVVPGEFFGLRGSIRLCVARPPFVVEAAVSRLASYFQAASSQESHHRY